jgi:hypothetical protein
MSGNSGTLSDQNDAITADRVTALMNTLQNGFSAQGRAPHFNALSPLSSPGRSCSASISKPKHPIDL